MQPSTSSNPVPSEAPRRAGRTLALRVVGLTGALGALLVPPLLAAGVPGVMTVFSNGQVADAGEINHNFADLDGRVDVLEARPAGGLVAANMVRSEGGTGSGSSVVMLSLTVDLTGMAGRWVHLYGGTAISEASNTANTSILKVVVDNGTEQTVAGIRQGIGVNSVAAWDGNTTAAMATQGYFMVTAAQAVPNVTFKLKGGIDAGAFRWGDQVSYTYFDGQQAGGYLGYAIF